MHCVHCQWPVFAGSATCANCGRNPAEAPRAPAPPPPAAQAAGGAAVWGGLMPRLLASGVDAMVSGLLGVAIVVALGAVWGDRSVGLWGIVIVVLPVLLVMLLLPAAMDSWSRGSFGKRLFGLRVLTRAGERPGIVRSLLRTLGKYVLHPMMPFVLVVAEHMAFDRHSLHNLLLGSVVVSTRADAAAIDAALQGDAGLRRYDRVARVLGIVVIAFLLLCVAAVVGAVRDDTPPDARRTALKAATTSARQVAADVGTRWVATGAFPANWDGPTPALAQVVLDPAAQTVTATAVQPEIAGVRIVLRAEAETTRNGSLRVRKWHCGSPDVPARDMPLTCRGTP